MVILIEVIAIMKGGNEKIFKMRLVSTLDHPGTRIQELRVQARISSAEAGIIAKVSQSLISNIENKPDCLNYQNPRHRDIVKRLARAFAVTPEYIWYGVHSAAPVVEETRAPYNPVPEQSERPGPPAPLPFRTSTTSTVMKYLLARALDDTISLTHRQEARRLLEELFESFSTAS